jgi:hypothetical protein
MTEPTNTGLNDCVELVATMWTQEVANHTHERQARHAAAMLLSGSGINWQTRWSHPGGNNPQQVVPSSF